MQKLVQNPNKATTVFSSAKYLGPEKLAGYTPVFLDAPPALRHVHWSDTSDLPDKQVRAARVGGSSRPTPALALKRPPPRLLASLGGPATSAAQARRMAAGD